MREVEICTEKRDMEDLGPNSCGISTSLIHDTRFFWLSDEVITVLGS